MATCRRWSNSKDGSGLGPMEPAHQLWPTYTQASFMHERNNLSKSLLVSVTNQYTWVVPWTWPISLKEPRLPNSEEICIGMKRHRGSHRKPPGSFVCRARLAKPHSRVREQDLLPGAQRGVCVSSQSTMYRGRSPPSTVVPPAQTNCTSKSWDEVC